MMLDVTNIAGMIEQLSGASLDELRVLHSRIVEAEEITRSVIRRREAQERRASRLKERGLSIVGATG